MCAARPQLIKVCALGLITAMGLLAGCSAPAGQDGRGGAKAWVASFFFGSRPGYEMNEGYDVSMPEGLRAIPYVAYITGLAQAFAASSGRTDSEAIYENGLAPATYGGFSLDALDAAQQDTILSAEDAKLYGHLLATGSHLNFATARRAKEMNLVNDGEYKALLQRLVKPNGQLTEVIVDVNPANRGLLAAALEAGVLTPGDLHQLIAVRLRRPNYLCAETLLVAQKAGAIDAAVRKTGIEFVLCRSALRILGEARRAGTAPPDATARTARLSERLKALRAWGAVETPAPQRGKPTRAPVHNAAGEGGV